MRGPGLHGSRDSGGWVFFGVSTPSAPIDIDQTSKAVRLVPQLEKGQQRGHPVLIAEAVPPPALQVPLLKETRETIGARSGGIQEWEEAVDMARGDRAGRGWRMNMDQSTSPLCREVVGSGAEGSTRSSDGMAFT